MAKKSDVAMDVRAIHPGGRYIIFARNITKEDTDSLSAALERLGVTAMVVEGRDVDMTIYEVR